MGQSFSHFWKQSFFIPAPTLTEKNLPDQKGRVFIITGSNTGVGYQLAQILYGRNGTVFVAARTESKALSAIQQIKELHPKSEGELHFLKLDLSDLPTIKGTVADFLSRSSRLDVLVQNAGVMDPPANSRGPQGHELQFATNILGPFIFAQLLRPILKTTAALQDTPPSSVRVSWAGSLAVDLSSARPGGLKFHPDGTLDDYKTGGPRAYGTTKAANAYLAAEFGRRYGNSDGVLHNAFNPGNLQSDLQRHSNVKYGAVAAAILRTLLYPAIFGAYTELYAGWSEDLTLPRDQGAYIWPWGRKGPVRSDIQVVLDRILQGKEESREDGTEVLLWRWCERETGKYM